VLPASEALRRILEQARPRAVQEVVLAEAAGRVLARNLASPLDFPRFDNSAMDGYAVRSADLSAAPLPRRLQVLEHLAAGGWPTHEVGPGQAIKIMTGAPIPSGADCVVPVEQTDGGLDEVEIRAGAAGGSNVRPAGEDIRSGDLALEAGTTLHPTLLGYLASLGIARVPVLRPVRVGILTTGDELVAPGMPLGPGQIYSSNDLCLAGMARNVGAEIRVAGPVADRLEAVLAAIEDLAGWAEVLLSSGGVSMGDYDLVRVALDKLGFREDFYRVQIKPGKPLVFGRLGETLVFGLPGNPASAVITFLEFVEPALLSMSGAADPGPPRLRARASEALHNKGTLRFYLRVALEQHEAELRAVPLTRQGSGLLRSLAQADGLAILEPEMQTVPAGALLEVRPLPFGGLGFRPSRSL
jgi:molybdopterin molybdotransferase